MVLDHEKRVREVEVVEGGFLDLGFTLYRVRFEVIEVEGNEKQCIIRYTIEYELKEEAVENIALVSTHRHRATLCSVFAPQQWQLIYYRPQQ